MVFISAAFQDGVEGGFDLSSFVGVDDPRIHERLAVRDACGDVRFKQPAIEAVGVVELSELRIDLPFESPAPKFFRHTRSSPPSNSLPQESEIIVGSGQYRER